MRRTAHAISDIFARNFNCLLVDFSNYFTKFANYNAIVFF